MTAKKSKKAKADLEVQAGPDNPVNSINSVNQVNPINPEPALEPELAAVLAAELEADNVESELASCVLLSSFGTATRTYLPGDEYRASFDVIERLIARNLAKAKD